MGNRRQSRDERIRRINKARQVDFDSVISAAGAEKVTIPKQDKVVVKRVPAKLDHSEIANTAREDVEIIGEAIIYEDGTQTLLVDEDISEEARAVLYSFSNDMLSIQEEPTDGPAEQE